MGISITYFFGLRMGVGMGMVFIYNQLLISGNTLHHFIFQKIIPRIYDVVHYKHFFRDHSNLVILKKRKKFKKKHFS
jgi:hypothetical protein